MKTTEHDGVEEAVVERRANSLTGFDGNPLTLSDLAPTGTVRWVMRRKAEVALAVNAGMLTIGDAFRRYPGLTLGELDDWRVLVTKHGQAGLRATRVQQYH